MSAPLLVFASYAREDEEFLHELDGHLSSLKLEQLITTWHDRQITAGRRWEGDLDLALDSADVVLLLISSHFLSSEYCGREAARAVERWQAKPNQARVVPVILRDVEWQKVPIGREPSVQLLGLLQALPKDGLPVTSRRWDDRDQAYRDVVVGVRRVVDELTKQRVAQAAPVAPPPPSSPVDAATAAIAPGQGPISPPVRDRMTAALDKLAPFLETDCITWLIGSRAARADANDSSRDFNIARSLLADLNLVERSWSQLLPPVDVAASYYAAKAGVARLEQEVTDLIAKGATGKPALYDRIALLISLATLRVNQMDPRTARSAKRNSQLIITTNLDLMMERALLAAGLSFTRLVQHQAEPRLEVTEFWKVQRLPGGKVRVEMPESASVAGKADTTDLDPTDLPALDRVIASFKGRQITLEGSAAEHSSNQNPLESLSLKELQAPVLYKLRGSLDISESCAISAEQYLDFCLHMADHFVPTQIRTIVAQTPAVLLGYGFLDADFRLIYYTFPKALIERKEKFPLYAVQRPPALDRDDHYRFMELNIWEDLKESGPRKAKILTLEDDGAEFVRRLIEQTDPDKKLRDGLAERGLSNARDGVSRGE